MRTFSTPTKRTFQTSSDLISGATNQPHTSSKVFVEVVDLTVATTSKAATSEATATVAKETQTGTGATSVEQSSSDRVLPGLSITQPKQEIKWKYYVCQACENNHDSTSTTYARVPFRLPHVAAVEDHFIACHPAGKCFFGLNIHTKFVNACFCSSKFVCNLQFTK